MGSEMCIRDSDNEVIFAYYISVSYTHLDADDDMQCVDLGGRRIIKKIFFFKPEDGIRDVERSRGLGDVYKRQ